MLQNEKLFHKLTIRQTGDIIKKKSNAAKMHTKKSQGV